MQIHEKQRMYSKSTQNVVEFQMHNILNIIKLYIIIYI